MRVKFTRGFGKAEQRMTFRTTRQRHHCDADSAYDDSREAQNPAPEKDRHKPRGDQAERRRCHCDEQQDLIFAQNAHGTASRYAERYDCAQGAEVMSGLPVSIFTGTETCSCTMCQSLFIFR